MTRPLTEAQKQQIVALRAGGMSASRIAAKFDICTATAQRIIKQALHPQEVKPRKVRAKNGPDPKFNAEQREEIKRLYFQEGLTQPALAKRFGTSHTTIMRIVNADYKAKKAVRNG